MSTNMDTTEGLDRILEQFAIATHEAKHGEDETQNFSGAKQAILDWVNETVVRGEEPYYGTDYEAAVTRGGNELKVEQRDILRAHGWKEGK